MRDGKPLLTDFGYRAVGNAGVESGSCRREGVFTNRAALRGPHVVDTIKRWRMPGWIYTHIASGEKRDQVTAARLKRMGVTPGFPDLVFFGPHGEVCFIELKAERGRLSESRLAIKGHLEAGGHGYHCSSDYREVIETLKGWGVLRSGINVQ